MCITILRSNNLPVVWRTFYPSPSGPFGSGSSALSAPNSFGNTGQAAPVTGSSAFRHHLPGHADGSSNTASHSHHSTINSFQGSYRGANPESDNDDRNVHNKISLQNQAVSGASQFYSSNIKSSGDGSSHTPAGRHSFLSEPDIVNFIEKKKSVSNSDLNLSGASSIKVSDDSRSLLGSKSISDDDSNLQKNVTSSIDSGYVSGNIPEVGHPIIRNNDSDSQPALKN
jgi:hypothetical protein